MKKTTHTFLIPILIIFSHAAVMAQSFLKITSVSTLYNTSTDNTSYTATGTVAASGSYTMKFGTNSGLWTTHIQKLDAAASSSGSCFAQIPSNVQQIVKLRRADNALITGTSACIWMEGTTPSATGGTCSNRLPYCAIMDTVFSSGWFNAGTDNLFNNTVPSNNNNNIERFDVILPGGYVIINANTQGIILFERGVDGGHDRVKIAGISGLNASNDPTSFKSGPVAITAPDWGDIGSSSVSFTVLRKDALDSKLRPTNKSSSQNRGGIFVPFSKLGFSNGQTVYGYSLMGYDVTAATAANILLYTNTTYFPRTTLDADGGIDLIGVIYFYEVVNVCGGLLPITLSQFNGQEDGTGNMLSWQTESEEDSKKFEIEWSPDGQEFHKIGETDAKGNSVTQSAYSFYHFPVMNDVSYYRLNQVDENGSSSYSDVITVNNVSIGNTAFSIFPSVANVQDHILITGLKPSEYLLTMYSLEGKVVMRKNIVVENALYETDLGSMMTAGNYIVQCADLQTGNTYKQKLFIK